LHSLRTWILGQGYIDWTGIHHVHLLRVREPNSRLSELPGQHAAEQ
jgi:hypothetical protein